MFASPFEPWCGFAVVPIGEGAAELRPEEWALLSARAVEKRRVELVAGRAAARRALRSVGGPEVAIGKGARGQPLWPQGWVGAITHSGAFAAAVVAPAWRTAGLGLVLERLDAPIDVGGADMVCLPVARAWLGRPDDPEFGRRLRRLFSAKETVFKATFPLAEVFLDFVDARLESRDSGFEVTLLVDASPRHPAGTRFAVGLTERGGYVLSSAALPPLPSDHAATRPDQPESGR